MHKTLDLFTRRELSKREAHNTILDTLEGNGDLRQELMDILMHPVARWGPDDFDLPAQRSTQPPLETAPQFLQPAHEPQMRLPSFSSWFPLPQNDQSASLTMFNGYGGFSRQQSLASSPSLPVPPPFQLPNPRTHLWADDNTETTYVGFHDDGVVPLPVQTAFRNPWQGSNYTDTWTNDNMGFPPDNTNVGGHFDFPEPPALPFNHDLRASLTYPQYTEPYTTPTLLQQETPHSSHTPHPTHDATPSPIAQGPMYTMKLEEQQPADFRALPIPSSQSPPSVSRTNDAAEAAEVEQSSTRDCNQSVGEPFIHILCGKGFATLTGVKKHHWGKKVNDLATTTGCWAKYKKPDVAWDDHPSCKDGRSTSVVIKSLPPVSKQSQTKASKSQSKTPSAVDVPQLNPIPGFPTLEYLPHTVAQTVNAGNGTVSSSQEPDVVDHTHRLASRSSFDSLLTAVNVVSQIDAPKPKGRTESIALHLDAQVAAAEQHSPFIPDNPPTSSFNPPPAALNTTGSAGMGEFPNDMSGYPVNYGSEEQPSVLPSEVKEHYVAAALSRPFRPFAVSPSGPARKKRKV